MAMFKMNYFHWHLTDDHLWTIEIKNIPVSPRLALYAGTPMEAYIGASTHRNKSKKSLLTQQSGTLPLSPK